MTLPRVTELFAAIKAAENELQQIRSMCKHASTYEGTWSWGPGRYVVAKICNDCDDFVEAVPDKDPFPDGTNNWEIK